MKPPDHPLRSTMSLPFKVLMCLVAMVASVTRAEVAAETVAVPKGATYVNADGAVVVVGYNDMAEMLGALTERFSAAHPGIRFELVLKGTRTAPPALARGESAFAPMGAEFSPRELTEYRAATGGEPWMFRVAHCALDPRALSGPLAIIVPSGSPLTSLTLGEVTEIFSGRANRGLHLYGLAPETALGLDMRKRTLGGHEFGKGFTGFPQSRDVVAAVAADPAGIGFAAAMRANSEVKVLALAPDAAMAPVALTEANLRAGLYPLDRYLLIYSRRPLDPLVREFLRFVLSTEGQEIIGRGTLGYLPLNSTEMEVERTKLN